MTKKKRKKTRLFEVSYGSRSQRYELIRYCDTDPQHNEPEWKEKAMTSATALRDAAELAGDKQSARLMNTVLTNLPSMSRREVFDTAMNLAATVAFMQEQFSGDQGTQIDSA